MKNENNVDSIGEFMDTKVESKLFLIKHIIIAVVFGAAFMAFVLILTGLYEIFLSVEKVMENHNEIKDISLMVLESVDLFLFGMVMIIFSLGSYDLFISKIDNVGIDGRDKSIRPQWLGIKNFGELKALFVKVIILILNIMFLELLIRNSEYFVGENLYNLLIIPIGVLLMSYSLKLMES